MGLIAPAAGIDPAATATTRTKNAARRCRTMARLSCARGTTPQAVPAARIVMLTRRIIVDSTLICGGVAVRDWLKMRTGNVVVLGPDTKYVMMKSSIDNANDAGARPRGCRA